MKKLVLECEECGHSWVPEEYWSVSFCDPERGPEIVARDEPCPACAQFTDKSVSNQLTKELTAEGLRNWLLNLARADNPTTPALKKGDKVIFPEENCLSFGQDHGYWFGVPESRTFTVAEVWGDDEFGLSNRCKLVAEGYGLKGAYGNGAIYMNVKDVLPYASGRRPTWDDDWEVVEKFPGHAVGAVIRGRFDPDEFRLLWSYCEEHDLTLAKGIHDIVVEHLSGGRA